MKYLLPLLLLPSIAKADWNFPDPARFQTLYQLYSYHPEIDLSVPLCKQEAWKHLSYVDDRCYVEKAFNYAAKCYEWDCPVPYDHVFYEPITGTTKVYRGSSEEIDQHYRSARSMLIQPQFRTDKVKKPKKPSKKGR